MASESDYLPGPTGKNASTKRFMVLVFDAEDEVVATEVVSAEDVSAASRKADRLVAAHQHAAGYQIWESGVRVHSTLPDAAPSKTPIAAALAFKLPRAHSSDE